MLSATSADPTPPPHDATSLASTSSTPFQDTDPVGSSSNQITSSPPRKRQRTRTIVEHPSSDQSRQQTMSPCPPGSSFGAESSTFDHSSKGKGRDCLEEDLDLSSSRDEHFYFPDADCVIRVGNTLFRVSDRFCTIRSSSYVASVCLHGVPRIKYEIQCYRNSALLVMSGNPKFDRNLYTQLSETDVNASSFILLFQVAQ